MKWREDQLQELFKAARAVRGEMLEEMPRGLKERVLAHWRSTVEMEEAWRVLALVFRRALFCACLVMVLSVIWSAQELMSGPPSDVAIANYEVRSDLMP